MSTTKNPQDSTRRNIMASQKRDDKLKARIVKLEKQMAQVKAAIRMLAR